MKSLILIIALALLFLGCKTAAPIKPEPIPLPVIGAEDRILIASGAWLKSCNSGPCKEWGRDSIGGSPLYGDIFPDQDYSRWLDSLNYVAK